MDIILVWFAIILGTFAVVATITYVSQEMGEEKVSLLRIVIIALIVTAIILTTAYLVLMWWLLKTWPKRT